MILLIEMAGTVTSRHKACMQNDAQITLNSNLNVELKTEPTHLHPSESWALVCICSKKKKRIWAFKPRMSRPAQSFSSFANSHWEKLHRRSAGELAHSFPVSVQVITTVLQITSTAAFLFFFSCHFFIHVSSQFSLASQYGDGIIE